MSQLSHVRVEQDANSIQAHRVYVDGEEIRNVRAVNIDISPMAIPEVNITLASAPVFDGNSVIKLRLESDSIEECITAIRFEMLVNESFRDRLSFIINDVIGDMDKADRVVEEIANRWY